MPRHPNSALTERLYLAILNAARSGANCPSNNELVKQMGDGVKPSSIHTHMRKLKGSNLIVVERIGGARRRIWAGGFWTEVSTQTEEEYYKETGRLVEPEGIMWPDYSSHEIGRSIK